jgi:hypothetical protein
MGNHATRHMMRRRNSGPFVAQRDGTYAMKLSPDVQALLVHMFGELRDVLTTGNSNEPTLQRLFPVAYHQDPESNEEYQRLMRSELVASRLAAISRAVEVIDTAENQSPILTSGDMSQFMQSLNAIRLLLGTMLDVSEDDELNGQNGLEDDDPRLAQHHLYAYLGWLLEASISAQMNRGEIR